MRLLFPKAKLVGLGIMAILFMGLLLFPREPVYRGETLSYWIGEISNPYTNRQQVARQALHQIGPRAVPFLLRKARMLCA